MSRNNVWGMWVGIGLIGLGLLFMLGQFLSINLMRYLWPLFILAMGAGFFIGMFKGGRSLGALAVPGSVITAVGLILFFQNLFGLWATWTYAWALIITGAGVGLIIFGNWSGLPDLRRAGRVVIAVSLVMFLVFGLFFELGASLLGLRSPGGIFWPIALILFGLYALFGRPLFERVNGPMGRSTVDFGGAATNASVIDAVATNAAATNASAADAATINAGTEAPVSDTSAPGAGMPYSAGPNQEAYAAAPVASPVSVSGVRRLRFRALGDMRILQGEREGLEIEASEAVRERIRTDVHGDTLEVRYVQDWLDWLNPRFWNISPIRYTLYVRELELLDTAGLGNLDIPALVTQRLELLHDGTGDVTIRGLAANDLIVRQGGLGKIEIEGQTEMQEVDLSGTGSYHAQRLASRLAVVRLSGLGSAAVQVQEKLDAYVSGMGSIDYWGSPRLAQQVSGMGSVRRAGD